MRKRSRLALVVSAALGGAVATSVFVGLPAVAAPTTGLGIQPVGFNFVDGHQDLEHPITVTGITADTGLTSTEPTNGSFRGPRKVHGADDRQIVLDTRTSPHRRSGQINFISGGKPFICTGWLISADTVVTAGHCLANDSSDITFSPARNGYVDLFGSQHARQVWYDQGFGAVGRDWGVIKLDQPIGDVVGWYGITSTDGQDLTGRDARIIGYPGDKPHGTMWQHTGKVTRAERRLVYYDTDTYGGQSGSAVTDAEGDIAYAIHIAGDDSVNWSTRITVELFNTLVALTRL